MFYNNCISSAFIFTICIIYLKHSSKEKHKIIYFIKHMIESAQNIPAKLFNGKCVKNLVVYNTIIL